MTFIFNFFIDEVTVEEDAEFAAESEDTPQQQSERVQQDIQDDDDDDDGTVEVRKLN